MAPRLRPGRRSSFLPRGRLLLLLLPLLAACQEREATPEPLLIAAAASLRGVMPALAEAYRQQHGGPPPAVTYGASGDLRRQVQGGAPVDAVVFAAAAPVDALVAEGLVQPASRQTVASNRLVLIGPRGGPPLTFAALERLPQDALLAVGEPGAVPAGHYAREALVRLGAWEGLQGRLVFGGDVSAVLAYARRGEVAAAVVYATEAQGLPEVQVLDEARAPWAPRAEVVAGAVAGGRGAGFVDFLRSERARALWQAHGFALP